jgi:hypothetical protein
MGIDGIVNYFEELWKLLVKPGPGKFLRNEIAAKAQMKAAKFIAATIGFVAIVVGIVAYGEGIKVEQLWWVVGILSLVAIEAIALRIAWKCVGSKLSLGAFFISDCYYWGASIFFASVPLGMTYASQKILGAGAFTNAMAMGGMAMGLLVPVVLLGFFWKVYTDLSQFRTRTRLRSGLALVLFLGFSIAMSIAAVAAVTQVRG